MVAEKASFSRLETPMRINRCRTLIVKLLAGETPSAPRHRHPGALQFEPHSTRRDGLSVAAG
jgi:hypothetical protein